MHTVFSIYKESSRHRAIDIHPPDEQGDEGHWHDASKTVLMEWSPRQRDSDWVPEAQPKILSQQDKSSGSQAARAFARDVTMSSGRLAPCCPPICRLDVVPGGRGKSTSHHAGPAREARDGWKGVWCTPLHARCKRGRWIWIRTPSERTPCGRAGCAISYGRDKTHWIRASPRSQLEARCEPHRRHG